MPDRRHGLPFDDAAPPPSEAVSVSALTGRLKALVETAFHQVAVVGEISNCKQWSSGHLYFTLKDDHAQLRAVMFRTAVRTLTFTLEDGMSVVARGRLSVYDVKGEYQIVCDTLEPQGFGAMQAAFEQLKRRLQAEGLFDRARKRPLPVLPRRIGVITSLDGAAIRDIVRVLSERHPGCRVVVRPARVQGDGAAQDLVRALAALVRVPEIDVIIIGRGGGSAEDLWAFNDEALARAIAACPVPVISAVGHEVDVTIADFVADVRAATPSNAAELVVDRADSFHARIGREDERLAAAMTIAMSRRWQRYERAADRLDRWPDVVALRERDTQELALRLRHAVAHRTRQASDVLTALSRRLERRDVRRVAADARARLVVAAGRLRHHISRRQAANDARVATLAARLDALSPLAVLGRGYAVCWNDARTSIIRHAQAVRPGDGVRVTLADGELRCRVDATS